MIKWNKVENFQQIQGSDLFLAQTNCKGKVLKEDNASETFAVSLV